MQMIILWHLGKNAPICAYAFGMSSGPVDLPHLSIIDQMLMNVRMCLSATTILLPSDISNNGKLQNYEWAGHSPC